MYVYLDNQTDVRAREKHSPGSVKSPVFSNLCYIWPKLHLGWYVNSLLVVNSWDIVFALCFVMFGTYATKISSSVWFHMSQGKKLTKKVLYASVMLWMYHIWKWVVFRRRYTEMYSVDFHVEYLRWIHFIFPMH